MVNEVLQDELKNIIALSISVRLGLLCSCSVENRSGSIGFSCALFPLKGRFNVII